MWMADFIKVCSDVWGIPHKSESMAPCTLPLRGSSLGRWHNSTHGMRFDLEQCRLRRFDSSSARRCLSGRNMVLVGQSWTRYIYMSLVYLLDQGKPPTYDRGSPSVCWEKSWAMPKNESWPDWLEATGLNQSETDSYSRLWLNFFHRTSTLFSSSGGHEVCDCSRRSFSAPHQENRFYERNGTRVSYIQASSVVLG